MLAFLSGNFTITKAFRIVIVHQPNGLHEGIADGRTDKLKSAAFQIPAQCI
jgi:hypothetical protein